MVIMAFGAAVCCTPVPPSPGAEFDEAGFPPWLFLPPPPPGLWPLTGEVPCTGFEGAGAPTWLFPGDVPDAGFPPEVCSTGRGDCEVGVAAEVDVAVPGLGLAVGLAKVVVDGYEDEVDCVTVVVK
jgi:hypothetical protein